MIFLFLFIIDFDKSIVCDLFVNLLIFKRFNELLWINGKCVTVDFGDYILFNKSTIFVKFYIPDQGLLFDLLNTLKKRYRELIRKFYNIYLIMIIFFYN